MYTAVIGVCERRIIFGWGGEFLGYSGWLLDPGMVVTAVED